MTKPLEALIAKINKQTENFDTVILKEDEALSLADYIESSNRKIDQLISDIQMAIAEIATLKQRIAELEASQLAVKLPEPLMPAQHTSGELFMTPDNVEHGGYLNRDDVLRSLKKTGITVQGDE